MKHGSNLAYFWSRTERHLKNIVLGLIILNLLDLVLTLGWVQNGIAREANILLHRMITYSPALFALFKGTIVTAGALLLWKLRSYRLAMIGIVLSFTVYSLLLLYHLHMANIYLISS